MIPSHHLNGLIYPDFAAFCSSGISWCITYPAPLHTSKDPSPCTPSSSELLPMPPFSAWFSVCPDMPQLVRSTSFQKQLMWFLKDNAWTHFQRGQLDTPPRPILLSPHAPSSPLQGNAQPERWFFHHRHHDRLTRPCSAAIGWPVTF